MKGSLSITVISVVAAVALLTQPIKPSSVIDTACYGADAYSNGEITFLTAKDTATTSEALEWRQSMHLPTVTPSQIVLVSDSIVCSRALSAFNAATQYPTGPATNLYLIGVGNVYVASNPHFQSGEWTQRIVFDSAFSVLASYLK